MNPNRISCCFGLVSGVVLLLFASLVPAASAPELDALLSGARNQFLTVEVTCPTENAGTLEVVAAKENSGVLQFRVLHEGGSPVRVEIAARDFSSVEPAVIANVRIGKRGEYTVLSFSDTEEKARRFTDKVVAESKIFLSQLCSVPSNERARLRDIIERNRRKFDRLM